MPFVTRTLSTLPKESYIQDFLVRTFQLGRSFENMLTTKKEGEGT